MPRPSRPCRDTRRAGSGLGASILVAGLGLAAGFLAGSKRRRAADAAPRADLRRLAGDVARLRQACDRLSGLSRERERLRLDALEDAASADKARSRFLAAVNHELRTPLNAILGFAELIERQVAGPVGSDRYIAYARNVRRSGRILLDLVEDVLDYTRLDDSGLPLDDDLVDFRTILADAVRLVKTQAAEAGVVFGFAVDAALPACRGDAPRLRQAMFNLLASAIRCTPAGGRVDLSAAVGAGGDLVVTIRDTGDGIAAQRQAKLFEPFGACDDAYVRGNEEAGLRLAIARRVVERHGGRLSLASEIGRGTTVTIALPAERLDGTPDTRAA